MPESSFSYGGFTFRSNTSTIGNKDDYHNVESLLELGNVPLPEMMYPHNYLLVEHPFSGLCLRFNAVNALQSWHNLQLVTHGRIITTPKNDNNTVTHAFAVSSSSFISSSADTEGTGSVSPHKGDPSLSPGVRRVDVTHYDWTYMNNYEGDIQNTKPNGNNPTLSPSTGTLPLPILTKRSTILYYAQVPLYASDLADRGIVECNVKIRVMEEGFLILLRTYLRKDRESVWLRDVRWFGEILSSNLTSKDTHGMVLTDGTNNDEQQQQSSIFPSVLKDVQLRYSSNMDNLLQSLPHITPSSPSSPSSSSNTGVPSSILPSFLQTREQGQGSSFGTSSSDDSMMIVENSSTTAITVSLPPKVSLPLSSLSPSSPSRTATIAATAVPVLRKSPIHPVVLQSMRDRAAKQGYLVDDDGTMRNMDGTLIPNGNETLSPTSVLTNNHAIFSSSSSLTAATENQSSIAVQLFPVPTTTSSSSSSVVDTLPDYFRNENLSPNIDAIFALPVSSVLPHYNITADEVYQSLSPEYHSTFEVVIVRNDSTG